MMSTSKNYYQKGTRGIYAVIDPRDDSIVFVGASTNIEAVFTTHFANRNALDAKRPARRMWKEAMRNSGVAPRFRVLQEIPRDDMKQALKGWLQRCKAMGQATLNQPIGRPVNARNKRDTPSEMAALREENARLRALLAEIDPLLQ